MATTNQYFSVDSNDNESVNALLNAFGIRYTEHEDAIRRALGIHAHPFALRLDVDREDPAEIPPMLDAFTFDIENDELIVYSLEPGQLTNALLEMAMYLRGFNTTMGVDEPWKTEVCIGAWRYIRERFKEELGIASYSDWDKVQLLHRMIAFDDIVRLAACPGLNVVFLPESDQRVPDTYRRLIRVMQTVGQEVNLEDYRTFNRRLSRALLWIEQSMLREDGMFGDYRRNAGGELTDSSSDESGDSLF